MAAALRYLRFEAAIDGKQRLAVESQKVVAVPPAAKEVFSGEVFYCVVFF